MLTLLTKIRSTKVFRWVGYHPLDGHHQILTFSNIQKFGTQKFLPDRNLALKYHYRTYYPSWTLTILVLFCLLIECIIRMPKEIFQSKKFQYLGRITHCDTVSDCKIWLNATWYEHTMLDNELLPCYNYSQFLVSYERL